MMTSLMKSSMNLLTFLQGMASFSHQGKETGRLNEDTLYLCFLRTSKSIKPKLEKSVNQSFCPGKQNIVKIRSISVDVIDLSELRDSSTSILEFGPVYWVGFG